jgi:hypothetical protein
MGAPSRCTVPHVTDDYESFEPGRIKHLELIQAVVGRLGNDGFLMKGWALTVAGAFYGFAINKSSWQLAAAALVPTAIFWGLDAYFLRCERLFRCLYSKVRAGEPDIKPFFMGATGKWFVTQFAARGDSDDVAGWWGTVLSTTLVPFYGSIVASGIVVTLLLVSDS